MQSYYEILSVKENASKQEIKVQYHKLARMYHPDVNSSLEAEKFFKEINRAASILLDDEKRKKYDDLRTGYKNKFENNNKNEAKNKEILFPKKGEDITLEVTISIKEAILGCERVVNVSQTRVCETCHGRKFSSFSCPNCKGKGEITKNRKITVKIPPSIKNKTKLRIKNEGKEGKNGGERGNLYIIVNIEEIENLKIKDDVVYFETFISPYTAVLGGDIKVSTLWGETTLKIPPLTKSNQSFKIMNVGVFDKRQNKKGDEIVKVIIQIPSNISDEEYFLYEKLKEINLKKKNARNY